MVYNGVVVGSLFQEPGGSCADSKPGIENSRYFHGCHLNRERAYCSQHIVAVMSQQYLGGLLSNRTLNILRQPSLELCQEDE